MPNEYSISQGIDLGKFRFLIADDQADARTIVQSVLMKLGFYNIHQASNGFDALEVARTKKLDFVICDWNMPGITGLEVLKTFRELPEYQETPFVMLTSEAYRENVMRAVKAGVTDYISKPFSAKFLSEKILEIFENSYGEL